MVTAPAQAKKCKSGFIIVRQRGSGNYTIACVNKSSNPHEKLQGHQQLFTPAFLCERLSGAVYLPISKKVSQAHRPTPLLVHEMSSLTLGRLFETHHRPPCSRPWPVILQHSAPGLAYQDSLPFMKFHHELAPYHIGHRQPCLSSPIPIAHRVSTDHERQTS